MSPLYRTMIADPHYSKATTATPVGWDPILVDDLDASSEASTPTVTPRASAPQTPSDSQDGLRGLHFAATKVGADDRGDSTTADISDWRDTDHVRRGRAGEDRVRVSKKLSAVLRHGIHQHGLTNVLRPDGFVPLASLLALPTFRGVTESDVRRTVSKCDKCRFAMGTDEAGLPLVRANQGHSIKHGLADDAMLLPLDAHSDVQTAVHGTYHDAWAKIAASGGLSRMSRRHIHLAVGLPGDSGVVSGMRKSAQVLVFVDVARAIRAGIPFYKSDNNVILTPGVGEAGLLPCSYFSSVVDARTGAALWHAERDTAASA